MKCLWLLATLAVAVSPFQAMADDPNPSNRQYDVKIDIKNNALVSLGHIWPRFSIDVCWQTENGTFPTEKATVIDIVNSQIGSDHSKYSFVDKGQCNGTTAGRIVINIGDSRPNSEIGFQTGGSIFSSEGPTNMHLNFEFRKWDPLAAERASCSTEPTKTRCIQVIAVHEFMHAVGFLHEHIRDDATKFESSCFGNTLINDERNLEIKQENASFDQILPVPVYEYDKNSIMNYCFDLYHAKPELSVGDLAALKLVEKFTKCKIDGSCPLK
jgi:hypothetical protein